MREILFRGKRRDNGSWETGSLVMVRGGISGEQVSIADKMTGYLTPVVPRTVGQYTGLTDKNGKKIFEGDILPIWEYGEEHDYKVIYNGDCFMLSMLDSEQGSYPLSVKHKMSRVTGNIYDNPELLGGDDK